MSIQEIHTEQRTSSPWWVVGVIHTVIFTHLFYLESSQNSHFEGSKQEEIDALRPRDYFYFDCGSEFDFAGWMES